MAKEKSAGLTGFIANVIIMAGRFLMERNNQYDADCEERIMLVWKRQDVSVETKERGEDYMKKLYPKLDDKSLQGDNWVYKYKIPTGISLEKIRKSINDIEFDLKTKVTFNLLEGDEEANFSLAIPAKRITK